MVEPIKSELEQIKHNQGFVEKCVNIYHKISGSDQKLYSPEKPGSIHVGQSPGQRTVAWQQDYHNLSPFPVVFQYNYRKYCTEFLKLHEEAKSKAFTADMFFIEVLQFLPLLVFSMSQVSVNYWLKMGVRIETLHRILRDLAFFFSDFISTKFMQEKATTGEIKYITSCFASHSAEIKSVAPSNLDSFCDKAVFRVESLY
ncbi:hypothetical protein K501DRAFT_267202 [Backusella circina FSU 941]|nr:hypothetical protein K501DRAFT_267202 [Backusella circina FSU 941]